MKPRRTMREIPGFNHGCCPCGDVAAYEVTVTHGGKSITAAPMTRKYRRCRGCAKRMIQRDAKGRACRNANATKS
jgi:hypothetical protein